MPVSERCADHQPGRPEHHRRDQGRHALRDADDRTLAAFHWHPIGASTYHAPHFHIPQLFTRIHFPCGRTSLEEIVRLCIKEFGVEPKRDDWDKVLSLNEGRFQLYRTWSTLPELAIEGASGRSFSTGE